MSHAYTEDQLVEQPAIGLFAELGWAVAGPPPNAGVAGEPRDGGLLGRETKGEVVLVSRLRAAQSTMPNPHPRPFSHWEKGGRQAGLRVRSLLPSEAITAAVDELTRNVLRPRLLTGQVALASAQRTAQNAEPKR
jgi:type I restriction enzyme, R subunit